jgi:hypothetical protein
MQYLPYLLVPANDISGGVVMNWQLSVAVGGFM